VAEEILDLDAEFAGNEQILDLDAEFSTSRNYSADQLAAEEERKRTGKRKQFDAEPEFDGDAVPDAISLPTKEIGEFLEPYYDVDARRQIKDIGTPGAVVAAAESIPVAVTGLGTTPVQEDPNASLTARLSEGIGGGLVRTGLTGPLGPLAIGAGEASAKASQIATNEQEPLYTPGNLARIGVAGAVPAAASKVAGAVVPAAANIAKSTAGKVALGTLAGTAAELAGTEAIKGTEYLGTTEDPTLEGLGQALVPTPMDIVTAIPGVAGSAIQAVKAARAIQQDPQVPDMVADKNKIDSEVIQPTDGLRTREGQGQEATAEAITQEAQSPTGLESEAIRSAVSPAGGVAKADVKPRPTPEEFESTGQDLHHGTSRTFDKFEPTTKGQFKTPVDRFYFSEDPAIASNFAYGKGADQVTFDKWAESSGVENPTTDMLRQDLQKAIDGGRELFYADPETGAYKKASSASELTDSDLFDGDVKLFRKGMSPKTITSKVYGKTLDLTDPKNIPGDLLEALKKEGVYDPTETMPNFRHEHSRELIKYAREHGYGKINVRDIYESGYKSTIALPEFIGYGQKDPYAAIYGDIVKPIITKPAKDPVQGPAIKEPQPIEGPAPKYAGAVNIPKLVDSQPEQMELYKAVGQNKAEIDTQRGTTRDPVSGDEGVSAYSHKTLSTRAATHEWSDDKVARLKPNEALNDEQAFALDSATV
jgi:hypothetical protein